MIPKQVIDFMSRYPMFRMNPSLGGGFILQGNYSSSLNYKEYGDVYIDYNLQIQIDDNFHRVPPKVIELSNKIDKTLDNHINHDGTICLGSPFQLKLVLKKSASLIYFFEHCVLPYLYAVTIKLKRGIPFVFGELGHGMLGLYQDYQEIFELADIEKIKKMLMLLSMYTREGNRQKCPCGCNRRVSTCEYFKKVQQMRRKLKREEWQEQYDFIK